MAAFAWALPATAEFYHYVTFSKRVKRMGSHAAMLLSTVALETLVSLKWSTGKFEKPAPMIVKVFWVAFIIALIVYPVIKFGLGRDPSTGKIRSGRATPSGRNTPTGRTTPTLMNVNGDLKDGAYSTSVSRKYQ
jgi:phosphatidylserine synthase 2